MLLNLLDGTVLTKVSDSFVVPLPDNDISSALCNLAARVAGVADDLQQEIPEAVDPEAPVTEFYSPLPKQWLRRAKLRSAWKSGEEGPPSSPHGRELSGSKSTA